MPAALKRVPTIAYIELVGFEQRTVDTLSL